MANKNLSRVLKTFLSSLPKEKFSRSALLLLFPHASAEAHGMDAERGHEREMERGERGRGCPRSCKFSRDSVLSFRKVKTRLF
jgi:hypothetical protein